MTLLPTADQRTDYRLRQIIAGELNIPPTFDAAATLTDIGADSLDHVSLGMALEQTFAVEIDSEAIHGGTTLADLTALVAGKAA